MIKNISCTFIDVINLTLASCDYTNCNETCYDYLMNVADECPVVFNNEEYLRLWNTLFDICNHTLFNENTISSQFALQ